MITTLFATTLLTGLVGAPAWAADRGDLVIVEVMAAPKGASNCEWIEVAATGGSVNLDGCRLLEVDPNSGVVEDGELDGITIPASATASSPAVIARDTASCYAKGSSALDCVAWDAKGDCLVQPTGTYSGVSINNSDPRQICIACGSDFTACDGSSSDTIIDELEFNWEDDFGASCDTDAYGAGCSTNLCGDVDVDANDDLDVWSVPDPEGVSELYNVKGGLMLATPGEESACPEVLPVCTADDVAITEIMTTPKSDPQSNSSHEWFEVVGTGEHCDLSECWLVQLEADGTIVDASYDDKGALSGGKYTRIDAPLSVLGGEYRLFSHGYSPVAVADIDGNELPADYEYDYSGFWMSPEEGRELAIYCGGSGQGVETDTPEALFGALVDKAPMYFEYLDAWCPEKGCSMNVAASLESSAANDQASDWCIPPLTDVNDDEDATFVGTPGQTGACQEYDWPQAGELVFTEFMADPEGTPDWFEMQNLAQRDVDLSWCILERYRMIDDQPASQQSYAFVGTDGNSYPVGAGAYQVFSQKSCLFDAGMMGDTADTGEAEVEVCESGEFIYSSCDLTASNHEYLSLSCGGVLIDTASVDVTGQGLRDGHSTMLDPAAAGGDPATANDDLENWCEAAFTLECFQVADDKCNYGTPGQPNECRDDLEVVKGGPGCMCSAGGSAGAASLAALLGLLLGLVRRRD